MNLISKALLGCLVLFSMSNLEAGFAKQVGPVIKISPPVGFPDPVYNNLKGVMDDTFQQPFYPVITGRNSPFPDNYLARVVANFNTYTGGGLRINPLDDQIILTTFAQNRFRDRNGIFFRFGLQGILARSEDGGLSWSYGKPIESILSLGGTISQQIGLGPQYDKCGTLYATGGFGDMHVNPPRTVPEQGFVFTRSFNDGKTWEAPRIIYSGVPDTVFVNNEGFELTGSGLTIDPANSQHLHFALETIFWPTTFYGSLYYFTSKDGGDTFTTPREIYNMVKDPVWVREHFSASYAAQAIIDNDPNYALYGGQALRENNIIVVDQNVLLMPMVRYYPQQGATTYTQSPEDSFTDIAFARSLNNGKTWCKVAGETDQFVFAFSHDPQGASAETSIQIFDGANNLPVVVSPYTERVYTAHMAGNPASDPDPTRQQFFPYIVLSRSLDKGATWSHDVQINVTPNNLSSNHVNNFDRQQALNPNMIMTKDGTLVVGYYDFRNWEGQTGEDRFTTPLNVDAWLALYRETDDPFGGNTGVGLDFIEEIRVTPQSFNGRITLNTNVPSTPPPVGFIAGSNYNSATGGGLGLAVNQRNELLVTFAMNNPYNFQDLKPLTIGYEGIRIDLNNRINTFLVKYQFPKPSNQ